MNATTMLSVDDVNIWREPQCIALQQTLGYIVLKLV